MASVFPSKKRRGTVFFLDTKSTCFLCLSEIHTVIDLEEEENEDEKAEKKDQFNMRVIHKYLKLQAGKLLATKITGAMNNDQLLKTNLAVKLCENCESMTETLSKLCLELEMIQMKLNHSLTKILDTLKNSEEDQARMQKFRSKMTQPLELLQVSVFDVMRKEMEEKCAKSLEEMKSSSTGIDVASGKTEKRIPDTQATEFTPPLQSIPPAPTSTSPIKTNMKHLLPANTSKLVKTAKFKCSLCGQSFVSNEGFYHHRKNKHPNQFGVRPIKLEHGNPTPQRCTACGLTLPSKAEWIRHSRLYCNAKKSASWAGMGKGNRSWRASSILNRNPVSSKAKTPAPVIAPPSSDNFSPLTDQLPCTKDSFRCSICPGNSAAYSSDSQLRNHVICIHPWYFFRSVQPPAETCSTSQFETSVQELIEGEVAACYDSSAPTSHTYKCVYCSYVTYNKRAMHIHVIPGHYTDLCAKIKLRHGWKKEPRKKTVSDTSTTDKRLVSRFGDGVLQRRRVWCKECGAGFTQQCTLNRHVRYSCFKKRQPSPPVPPPGAPAPVSIEVSPVCEFCGMQFTKRQYYNRHKNRGTCRQRLLADQSQADDSVPVVMGSFSLQTIPVVPVPFVITEASSTTQQENLVNSMTTMTEAYERQDYQQEFFMEEDEEETEQDFGATYGDTKIEVLDAPQVHLGGATGFPEQFGDTKVFMGESEMMLPDQDPLEF